ncbi:hypothetical protein SAMN02927923_00961 [Microvirga guangxiensis]|uniref:Uncharacterized protein n=1 Tax=Microvirga guangxiensis TaxID=549386 RepID=A0A1G5EDR8_9HYPH|nr:hypothetical protein SAMN02927923_00961 [Microvirga guangxiensis]
MIANVAGQTWIRRSSRAMMQLPGAYSSNALYQRLAWAMAAFASSRSGASIWR